LCINDFSLQSSLDDERSKKRSRHFASRSRSRPSFFTRRNLPVALARKSFGLRMAHRRPQTDWRVKGSASTRNNAFLRADSARFRELCAERIPRNEPKSIVVSLCISQKVLSFRYVFMSDDTDYLAQGIMMTSPFQCSGRPNGLTSSATVSSITTSATRYYLQTY
jgi:hypothetical protein